MNRWLMISVAVAVVAAVFATGWWMDPHGWGAPAQTAPTVNAAPMGDPAHEKAFLEAELRKKPGHSPVLLRLGQVERESGNLRDARRHLEQAVAGDQKLMDARLELSLVCYQLGDIKTALDQNRAILRESPGHPDALYNLGAISANEGEIEEARKYWREAVAAGPETPSGRKAAESLERLRAPLMRSARK